MISLAYDGVCELKFSFKNRKRRIGPTAASKILHFLFPDTFVMWDQRVVRARQNYDSTPNEYL
jgi:hypothetical protein